MLGTSATLARYAWECRCWRSCVVQRLHPWIKLRTGVAGWIPNAGAWELWI